MTAYVMGMIDVTDPGGYEVYKEMAASAVAGHGGKYVARAGRSEVLEGEVEAKRFVVLEFESYEKALEWWNSPEYEAAKIHRRKSSTATMMLVDGLS